MTKESLIKDLDLQRKDYLEKIPTYLMQLNSDYLTERRKIFEKFDLERETSFNLFEDLSIDNKFNEINHSKIIAKILDKNNKVIGDKEQRHLLYFEELVRQKNIKFDDFDSDYIIEREKKWDNDSHLGKIDIIIYEKEENGKCIIIENKITGKARDRDNQLARYYEIAEKLKLKVVAIVYLPLYNQEPSIHNYFGKYKKYSDKVKDVLCIITATDFAREFLDKCVSLAKEKKKYTTAVCIEQYSNFLKSKGDKNDMAKHCNEKFLEELLTDGTKMEIVEDIVEIWGNKNEIIYNVLTGKFEKHSFHCDSNKRCLKELNAGKEIFIFFCLESKGFEIGFFHEKGQFGKDLINDLNDILSEKDFISDPVGDKSWVWGYYKKQNLLGTYTDMFDQLLNNLNELEKKAKKILSKY
jgi:hypothetical protein